MPREPSKRFDQDRVVARHHLRRQRLGFGRAPRLGIAAVVPDLLDDTYVKTPVPPPHHIQHLPQQPTAALPTSAGQNLYTRNIEPDTIRLLASGT